MDAIESKNNVEDQTGAEGGPKIELQIPRILSGLEYLELIDKVFVVQAVNLCEMFTVCYEAKSTYTIVNEMGQQVYYAYEESTCCSRSFCCASRALTIHIMDMSGQEVIRVNKAQQMCAGYTCCITGQNSLCAFRIEVEAPPGRPVGFVSQSCSIWRKPKFVVLDADQNDVFSISGPCDCCSCLCCMCKDETFRFYSMEGEKIGKCAKKWNGCFRAICTDSNNFSITFPQNLDVKQKATLIGSMFLIDVLHFE